MSKAKTGTIFHWSEGERPALTQVVSDLQKVGLLPHQQSWWFAWREIEIKLPGLLTDVNVLPTDWDVLHIFSPRAELRQIRRGWRYEWLLLTEQELPKKLHLPRPEKEDKPVEQEAGFLNNIRFWQRNEAKEEVAQDGFGHSWEKSEQPYKAILSHRIMWGNRLRKPASGNSGVDEARGVVEFPRSLEYHVANEAPGNYDKALVADVCLYFDDEARLQTVRYMRIRHLPPGADEIRMKIFGKVMEEAF